VNTKSLVLGLFGAGAALVLAGCEAQVGDGYRGEVLLSLQGSVVLNGQSAADQVPVLAFLRSSGFALLDAHVEGEFPSRFRMEIFEAPPESALLDPTTGTATGFLTVVPKDHPKEIPGVAASGLGSCNPDETICTNHLDICSTTGICMQRDLTCNQEECPVVGDTEIPPDELASGARFSGYGEAGDTHSLTVEVVCDAAQLCHRVFRKCGPPNAYTPLAEFGHQQTCDVVSESGDARIKLYESVLQSAVGYDIVYAPAAVATSVYGPIPAGYSLFRTVEPDSDQAWIDSLDCKFDRLLDATDTTTCPPGVHKELVSPDEELTLRLGYRNDPSH